MEITSQADTAPILRDLPSRLLGRVATLVGKVAGDALAAHGAHRHQFAVLATLQAFGPASQTDLCRRTDIDRSDMNAILNALETEGMVGRETDPSNRRRNIVRLTKAGAARHDALRKVVEAAQDKALAALSAKERKELVRLLRVIHDDLAPGA